MLRRIESRTKRILLGGLLFLLSVFLLGNIVGILGASNLVWGEDNQYGIVHVPGKGVLHLPAREIDVSYVVDILGKGNETVDVPVPSRLALTVAPVDGRQHVDVTRDLGASSNANGDGVNSQRRVWKLHVPSEGEYRVRTRGHFIGGVVNPQLWFGHGPPLPGGWPWAVAAGLAALGWGIWLLLARRSRRRRPAEPFGGLGTA